MWPTATVRSAVLPGSSPDILSRRFGSLRCLFAVIAGAFACLPAASPAAVPQNGQGFALADDTYFVWPSDRPSFQATAQNWYGAGFADLGPASFRFQIYWNADPAMIERAKMLADYVRSQGVTEVVVTFKQNGPTPDAATYGASIRNIIGQLASRVDAWGPANEPNRGDTWLPGTTGAQLLAGYWAEFNAALGALDPSALRLSPEFVDRRDLASVATYINAYTQAGGGFGHVVGWHPDWGLHATTRATTDDLLSAVPPTCPSGSPRSGPLARTPTAAPTSRTGRRLRTPSWAGWSTTPPGLPRTHESRASTTTTSATQVSRTGTAPFSATTPSGGPPGTRGATPATAAIPPRASAPIGSS